MANRRLSMRKIREVLRLKYEKGFSGRQIAQPAGIGYGSAQYGPAKPHHGSADNRIFDAEHFGNRCFHFSYLFKWSQLLFNANPSSPAK